MVKDGENEELRTARNKVARAGAAAKRLEYLERNKNENDTGEALAI